MSLMKTHIQEYTPSEYHTHLANMGFDALFNLTAGVLFVFCNT